jgi:uncharacterized protein YdeI (YjbR/CyaY-like superfamily)
VTCDAADVAKSELDELFLLDAGAWRARLLDHHDASPGVWLVLTKKGGTATTLTYEQAVLEAVAFGWIDSQARRRDDETQCVRMTPRGPRSPWSTSNVERVAMLEAQGRMHAAGLAAVEAAKADGRWQRAAGSRLRPAAGPTTGGPVVRRE